MVVYNRSLVRSAPEDTASVRTVLSCRQFIDLQSQHPPKVLLREVDHSSTLRCVVMSSSLACQLVLQVDRESEILALNHNYETTLHKVQQVMLAPLSQTNVDI